MTNATQAVLNLADAAGFRILFADIHPDNHRSRGVIERCGFYKVDREPTIEGHFAYDRDHQGS